MCGSSAPPAPTPAPPPPPPPPPPMKEPMAPRIEEAGGSAATKAGARARRAGTSGLRTDLAIPGTSGGSAAGTGLNIPA